MYSSFYILLIIVFINHFPDCLLRSVYGSTNPHAHTMSMLSNVKVTLNNGRKPDVRRIPIGLTLNEVSGISKTLFFF